MSDGKYKTTKERLIKARERRTNRQNKGGDEEYSKCIVKEFKETESLRQRANYTECNEDGGEFKDRKIDLESILEIAENIDVMIHLLEPSPLSDKLVFQSRQLIVAIKKAILDRDGIKY